METSGTLYAVLDYISEWVGPELADELKRLTGFSDYITLRIVGVTHTMYHQSGVWWYHD